MREIRKSGSEGGGGREASSYLYHRTCCALLRIMTLPSTKVIG
jgi:hypothetical protein